MNMSPPPPPPPNYRAGYATAFGRALTFALFVLVEFEPATLGVKGECTTLKINFEFASANMLSLNHQDCSLFQLKPTMKAQI
jgi:hypothetical protein